VSTELSDPGPDLRQIDQPMPPIDSATLMHYLVTCTIAKVAVPKLDPLTLRALITRLSTLSIPDADLVPAQRRPLERGVRVQRLGLRSDVRAACTGRRMALRPHPHGARASREEKPRQPDPRLRAQAPRAESQFRRPPRVPVRYQPSPPALNTGMLLCVLVVDLRCSCGWTKCISVANASQPLANATKARLYNCGFCSKLIGAKVYAYP
jgi:hypothetical protein